MLASEQVSAIYWLMVIYLIRTLTWRNALTTEFMGSMITLRLLLLYHVYTISRKHQRLGQSLKYVHGTCCLVLTQVSNIRCLIRYMIFFQTVAIMPDSMIAVSPGYSVFQQVLKYLNSLKATWGLNHLNLTSGLPLGTPNKFVYSSPSCYLSIPCYLMFKNLKSFWL
jgi:hypothetical protein